MSDMNCLYAEMITNSRNLLSKSLGQGCTDATASVSTGNIQTTLIKSNTKLIIKSN